MAHELTTLNGKTSMAYVGQAPWHGLGQQLTLGADRGSWRRSERKGETTMTRDEICKLYDVDSHGVIQSPGKFEAEPVYLPYFYAFALDGSADTIDFGDDQAVNFATIEAEDAKEFPELVGDVGKFLTWEENSQGFVTCAILDAAELAELKERAERESETSEEEECPCPAP